MSQLLLLRHARAAWAEPGMRDFDRPLDANGRRDADAMGAAMAAGAYVPERVVCSNARRARETWEAVARHLQPLRDVIYTDQLYITDATGYANLIVEQGGMASILLIGHNPMIEDVCFALAEAGDEVAIAARASGFPAGCLAVISFTGSLAEARPGGGRLDAFLAPGEI